MESDNSRYDPQNAHAVHVQASYRDFLRTSKNINSLDNPLAGGIAAPSQLATDLRAAVSQYDDFPATMPMRIMSWGLLAKANAVHPPHIDRPGTCTWVAIEDGLKKWDIAFPPNEIAEEEAAKADAYGVEMALSRNYSHGWNWHSILLYPGTMLYVSFLISHSSAHSHDLDSCVPA